jgi:hypothetical protein
MAGPTSSWHAAEPAQEPAQARDETATLGMRPSDARQNVDVSVRS